MGNVIDPLRKGDEVTNPAAWKNGQVAINLISAAIIMFLNLGAVKWPFLALVSADTVNAIAVALLGLYNAIATIVSSRKVGI
jgi:hypothetical protein